MVIQINLVLSHSNNTWHFLALFRVFRPFSLRVFYHIIFKTSLYMFWPMKLIKYYPCCQIRVLTPKSIIKNSAIKMQKKYVTLCPLTISCIIAPNIFIFYQITIGLLIKKCSFSPIRKISHLVYYQCRTFKRALILRQCFPWT